MHTKESAPREFCISQKDAEKFGYTPGCHGCNSWKMEILRQPHNETCRNRFEELMKDYANVKNAKGKREEFEKKMQEEEESKKGKTEERNADMGCDASRKKKDPDSRNEDDRGMDVDCINQVINLVGEWVAEVVDAGFEELDTQGAWDDVHGGGAPGIGQTGTQRRSRVHDKKYMDSWFEIKVRGTVGEGAKDCKQMVILNRVLSSTEDGLELRADPKDREKVPELFGLEEEFTSSKYNGDREERVESEWERIELDSEGASKFRGIAARLNFLSQDCPDLQFPVKQGTREMVKPNNGSWAKVKKIARYLVNRKDVIWQFNWQESLEARGLRLTVIGRGMCVTGNPLQEESGCWGITALRRGVRLM